MYNYGTSIETSTLPSTIETFPRSTTTTYVPIRPMVGPVFKMLESKGVAASMLAETPEQPEDTATTQPALDKPSLIHYAYTLRDEERVNLFLKQNPFLIRLLLEARSAITAHFGDTKASLEVVSDPESDDEHLTLAILVALSAKDAHTQLKAFDRAWWIKAVKRAQGKLCIDVEFE